MTTIWVTFQQEGWHHWSEASLGRKYLSHSHRHMFHFRVEMAVLGNDREVELHDFKNWCQGALREQFDVNLTSYFHFDMMSCEDIAHLMVDLVVKKWPERWVAAEVSEDGENGARVEVKA